MLKIQNLSVKINKKSILNDFNLNIKAHEIHIIMGPNGIGKSTICRIIMGDDNYENNGSIFFCDQNIDSLSVTERARLGIYVVNQNPMAIEGVTNSEMLRIVLKEKTGAYIPIFEFNKKINGICDKLNLDPSFIHREINVGMSGGERKKNELLHLYMLEPKLIILDEIDSGLDIDSLKVVAQSINEYYLSHECSILIITHHSNILKYLDINYVHVLNNGKIQITGGPELIEKIEREGYKNVELHE